MSIQPLFCRRSLPCFHQGNAQLGQVAGAYTRNASGLCQRAGANLRQLFAGFQRHGFQRGVIKVIGDHHIFVALYLVDSALLTGCLLYTSDAADEL